MGAGADVRRTQSMSALGVRRRHLHNAAGSLVALTGTRHTAGLSALSTWWIPPPCSPGFGAHRQSLSRERPVGPATVAIGAILGSWLGVRHLPVAALRYILAALLPVEGGLWMLVGR